MSLSEHGKLDSDTVASLYVQHSEELRRFLVGLLRDHQLAADVLQATFTKMVERGHETQESSRKAWLFRVAYHEAMAFRRRQAVGDKAVRKLAWSRDTAGSSAEEPLIRLEAIELVKKSLEQLPPAQKQVVEMRIYEEKTFAVIAEELDIPLGTALARMRSALGKLRTALEHHEN